LDLEINPLASEKRKIYIKSRPFSDVEKMRNRSALFLIVLLIAMTFYGCSGPETGGGSLFSTSTSKNSGTSDGNYNKGIVGLKPSFLANNPPGELYDGQPFPVVFEIYNLGVTKTIPYVTLVGFDKNIVRIDWTNRPAGMILGKNESNPSGGYAAIDDNVRISLPSGVDTFPTSMTAITCYEYVTEGVSQVCVDPDSTNNKDDTCTVKLLQLSGGQGAPVAITKIDTRSSIGTNYFIITVSNMDKTGSVIKSDKVPTCTEQLTYQEVDVVDIVVANLGTQRISCEPNTIKLVNGVGTTTCEAPGLTGGAYTSSLQINLKYGYKTSTTKSLNIRRM
jgi:hypothetical protein